jgi:hypothetical protein
MTSGSLSKAVHLPTPSRPHYYRFIALFVVAIVIAHVVFSPLDSSEGVSRGKVKIGRYLLTNPKQWRIPEAPVEDQGYRKMGEWCTEEEYLDGEWVKREEEVDMSNIRKVFSYTVSEYSPQLHLEYRLIPLRIRLPGSRQTEMCFERRRLRCRSRTGRSRHV